MNIEALFLFLILLLGLVLCSFLGGNCNKEGFGQNSNSDSNNNNSKKMINSLSSNNNSSSGFNSNNNFGNSSNNTSNNNFGNSFNTNSSSNSGNNSNNSNFGNNSNNSNFGNSSNTSSSSNTDNYNHYSGSSSQLTNGSTFTEPNGGTVVVNTSSDGTQSLQVTPSGGGSPMTFTIKENMTTYSGNNASAAKFYGPNGQTAVVIKTNDGQQAIKITDSNNNSVTYTSSGTTAVHSSETNTTYFGSTGSNLPSSNYNTAYTGNAGNTGSVTGPQGNTAAYATGPQGNTVYGTNANNNNSYGGSAGSVTGPQGNTAAYATGPQGNTIAGTNAGNSSYGNDYYSTLPPGIPKSQIIPGDEDLYILKSQIVPPVCPVCPVLASNADKDESKCPACPAPQRCPEPAFECKKVPNYSAVNSSYLPMPVLNDFSTFGM